METKPLGEIPQPKETNHAKYAITLGALVALAFVGGTYFPNLKVSVSDLEASPAPLPPTLTAEQDVIAVGESIFPGRRGDAANDIKFTADGGPFTLQRAKFNLRTIAGGPRVEDNFGIVYLWEPGKIWATTTVTSVAGDPLLHGYIQFDNLSIDIASGGSRVLSVRLSPLDTYAGADSGDIFAVDLAEDGFLAVSASTSQNSINPVAGATLVFRQGYPIVIAPALSGPVRYEGRKAVLYNFNFLEYFPASRTWLKHITLEHMVSNPATSISGIEVYRKEAIVRRGIPSSESKWVKIAAAVEVENVAGGYRTHLTFNDNQFYNFVTNQGFEIRATVQGTTPGNEVTTRIISNDSTHVTGELDTIGPRQRIDDLDAVLQVGNVTAEHGLADFVWSDDSAGGMHNDGGDRNADGVDDARVTNDWSNGYLVEGLPSAQQLIRF